VLQTTLKQIVPVYGYIYKITNIVNNKIYIGQTTRNIQDRFNEHKLFARSNCHTEMAIIRAIIKYGENNFIIELITSAFSLNELNFLEIYYILYFNSLFSIGKGYNIAQGGTFGDLRKGYKDKTEWKKNLSESHKGRKIINNGLNYKMVKQEKINDYLLLGWKIGKVELNEKTIQERKIKNGIKHKQMIWINNNKEEIKIYKYEENRYNSLGYKRGRIKNKVWMTKDEKDKQVLITDIEKYKNQGYIRGRYLSTIKEKIAINKDSVLKYIDKKSINKYLLEGWKQGSCNSPNKGKYKNI
jgi:group I intron endonuclease